MIAVTWNFPSLARGRSGGLVVRCGLEPVSAGPAFCLLRWCLVMPGAVPAVLLFRDAAGTFSFLSAFCCQRGLYGA